MSTVNRRIRTCATRSFGKIILLVILSMTITCLVLLHVLPSCDVNPQTTLEENVDQWESSTTILRRRVVVDDDTTCTDDCARFQRHLRHDWPPGKPKAAVYYLIGERNRSISAFVNSLTSLDRYFNLRFNYPVIVFHEGGEQALAI